MKYGTTTILTGDAREQLAALPEGHFHSCVTSPPYWGLRSYIDHSDEIGREATLEEHLANLVEVFRGVKRVLRDDGTCWVNYGSAYFSGGAVRPASPSPRYQQGDDMLLHYRVAEALRADGWLVRSAIVWAKAISFCDTYSGSCMPESLNGWRWERCRKKAEIRDEYGRTEKYIDCPGCDKCNPNGGYVLRKSSWRPTSSYELVFLLAKAGGYYCDADAVRETAEFGYSPTTRGDGNISPGGVRGSRTVERGNGGGGRNLRSVWTINPQAFSDYSQTSRLVRASSDDASGDTIRITSPGCLVHGDCPDRVPMVFRGAHVADQLNHILSTHGRLVPALGDGSGLSDWLREHCSLVDTSGEPTPHNDPTATPRSSQTRRMDHVHGTNQPCTPSAETDLRTGDMSTSPELSGPHPGTPESNTAAGSSSCPIEERTECGTADILVSCSCTHYSIVAEKTSHFATYPEKLVEPIVKVSTSQKGCCPECGSPWARVVEATAMEIDRSDRREQIGSRTQDSGTMTKPATSRTLGWRPTCGCEWTPNIGDPFHTIEHDPIPCRVLDPFGGSGTTALVANRNGRDATIIELNPDYAAIARDRIGKGLRPSTYRDESAESDAPLFQES